MSGQQASYRLVRAALPDPQRREPSEGPGDAAQPLIFDPGQRAVIDHHNGPLRVLGGPGTGKTTALVEAVVARIASGVPPEKVLLLAFDRRTAAALREGADRPAPGWGEWRADRADLAFVRVRGVAPAGDRVRGADAEVVDRPRARPRHS
nr:UvrD-helicase domain-containing protein [Fodinicola feengrottensis]